MALETKCLMSLLGEAWFICVLGTYLSNLVNSGPKLTWTINAEDPKNNVKTQIFKIVIAISLLKCRNSLFSLYCSFFSSPSVISLLHSIVLSWWRKWPFFLYLDLVARSKWMLYLCCQLVSFRVSYLFFWCFLLIFLVVHLRLKPGTSHLNFLTESLSTLKLTLLVSFWFILQVWSFKMHELKSRLEIGCSIVKIIYHHLNGTL